MSSLDSNFDTLVERMKRGRDFDNASFEPVYYLVFPVSDILNVKQKMKAWTARLRNAGWTPETFSMAEAVDDILKTAPVRKIWEMADRKSPQNWERTNSSLANALSGGALQKRLEDRLRSLEGRPGAVLLVTDLEALHPYLRIGSIESRLYGQFKVPTVFFYPGERAGTTRLKFLGFYPEDGNYRSVHVGG